MCFAIRQAWFQIFGDFLRSYINEKVLVLYDCLNCQEQQSISGGNRVTLHRRNASCHIDESNDRNR
jgi:hypothetical protein